MIVYVDIVFLLNCFINFIFLFIIEKMYNDKINIGKIIFASIIGGCFIISFFFNYIIFNLLKIIGGLIIVLIGLKINNVMKLIVKISLFYIVNFAFVGILSSFRINTLILFSLSVTLILAFIGLMNFQKYLIIKREWKYNIIIYLNDKKLHLKAFLDSGNCATNDDSIPIIVLDKKYKKYNLEYKEQISIKTVNGNMLVDLYKPEQFFIEINKRLLNKEVLIIFKDIDEECLLNYKLLL